jgi:hypothetical protein
MSAKNIIVRPISGNEANEVIKRIHYSGKIVRNSQIHIGVFYNGKLEGAMQFGPSLDKRKLQGLVKDTAWNGFIELNRMAFSDNLPRNSESRAIAIAMRVLRKHAPKIEWVVSFADGTQCGDGTIYRASGFVLTSIKESTNLARLPDGNTVHKMTLESNPNSPRVELNGRSYYELTGGKYDFNKYVAEVNGEILKGFQLRYIYFLKPDAKKRLTVEILPFSEIDRTGARMYKGLRGGSIGSDAPDFRSEKGGANPTPLLQNSKVENAQSAKA